jgi:hypothetical protein
MQVLNDNFMYISSSRYTSKHISTSWRAEAPPMVFRRTCGLLSKMHSMSKSISKQMISYIYIEREKVRDRRLIDR